MSKLRTGLRWAAVAATLATPVLTAAAVLPNCSVTATGVVFGTYDPSSGVPKDAEGSVTVSCSALLLAGTVHATASLSTGSSGSFAPRRMSGPAAGGLPYNLYTTGSHSVVWGDGTGGSSTVPITVNLSGGILGLVAAKGENTATIFGRIPPGQTVTAGTYSDTITVTVSY